MEACGSGVLTRIGVTLAAFAKDMGIARKVPGRGLGLQDSMGEVPARLQDSMGEIAIDAGF